LAKFCTRKLKKADNPLQNSKRGILNKMVGGRHYEKMAHVKASELPSGSVPTKEK
jgi:hypothetical protein